MKRTSNFFPSGLPSSTTEYDARTASGSYSYYDASYGYDHRGRRIVARYTNPDGVETDRIFFYDIYDRFLGFTQQQVNPPGTSQQELWMWLDREPVYRLTFAPTITADFYYNDRQGTPRRGAAVDSLFGNPVVAYAASTEPFLSTAPQLQPSQIDANRFPMRIRFPGQIVDDNTAMWGTTSSLLDSAVTDLAANGAREYDPGYGGYTSSEPLLSTAWGATVGNVDFDSYASSQPEQSVDPSGDDIYTYWLCVAVCMRAFPPPPTYGHYLVCAAGCLNNGFSGGRNMAPGLGGLPPFLLISPEDVFGRCPSST